jgi:hypothetical protein
MRASVVIVEIPCVADHQLKVVIVVNGSRDVVVVLNKLGECNATIARVSVLDIYYSLCVTYK